MNKAELVFKAIDVLGHAPQNAKSFKGITCIKDISYGSENLQKGDLYFKDEINKDATKKPIVLYIHGGGFIKGDKKHRVTVSEYYANEDCFVFSINYRLPPEVDIFGQIDDCISALNFIKTLAESYNIDLENIFITGDSSGSCQTTFLAAIKYDDDLRVKLGCREVEVDIKGLMLMSGIYDVEALVKHIKLFGVIPQTAGMILNFKLKSDLSNLNEYEFYDCMSPSKFVNDKWCPVFISWAEDDIFCKGQGEAMSNALKSHIDDVSTYSVKGILNNHCYHLFLKSNKYAEECMRKSVDFINTQKEKVLVLK
ncbi:MAG: alpha/beta hydrolase [Ruminococcaceae bacterium]|nr:alpha/beta hydrolase [Oscillospiraceae bacterium]